MSERTDGDEGRTRRELRMGADMRELTAVSDGVARVFAYRNGVSVNEFRALLFVTLAQRSGAHLTAGELRRHMGLSGAAITYLVERMAATGHLRREVDPTDRRKVILSPADHGLGIVTRFFEEMADHCADALAQLPDADLEAAVGVLAAMIGALRTFRGELMSPSRASSG